MPKASTTSSGLAADMQEVGCLEAAAVVDIIERVLNRLA
jgi:hypothetical protein